MRVLLVEDDFDVAEGLAEYLEARDVRVDFAYSLGEARRAIGSKLPDVILLDVELPDGDGIAFCRDIANEGALPAPVLFLTARGRLEDRLEGFAAGCVDYIVKPFEPAELLARIRTACRYAVSRPYRDVLEAGPFALERATGRLRRGNANMAMQKSALRIVEALMEAAPGTVGREQLNDRLWDGDIPESDPLRAHIHALRGRLRSAFGCDPVVTVRNLGYRWDGDA